MGRLTLALGLATAAVWFALSTRSTAPAPLLRAIPLTSTLGNEIMPSFSPDGSQVAFASNAEKQYDIYVKVVGSPNALRLTSNPAYEGSPAWSPDGKWIAFLRDEGAGGSGIYRISPLGGSETRLAGKSFGMLAWSPDSQRLIWMATMESWAPSPSARTAANRGCYWLEPYVRRYRPMEST